MKKLFILFAILFCLISCQSKDNITQKDKELGQRLDTLKCMTDSISLTAADHGYLFDRLEHIKGSVLRERIWFGKYEFEINNFPNGNYLLTNPKGPYSLYITTKTVGAMAYPIQGYLKTMKITKLCCNK